MSTRVLIAEDEFITRMDLVEMLEEKGFDIVGQASDGFDAVDICRQKRPDLIIMDIKMPILDGIKAAKIIREENLASCIIFLTAYSDKEYIEEAKKLGVMNYLVKPIEEKSLIPAIEIAISKQNEVNLIQNQLNEAKKKLEDRQVIEKAKGIIMKRDNLTEDEAYSFMRKMSMNKRCSLRKISDIIVQSESI